MHSNELVLGMSVILTQFSHSRWALPSKKVIIEFDANILNQGAMFWKKTMGNPSCHGPLSAPKSNIACLISSIRKAHSRSERSNLSLCEKRFCQSRRNLKGLRVPKSRCKCSKKAFPRFKVSFNPIHAMTNTRIKFLLRLSLAIRWKTLYWNLLL